MSSNLGITDEQLRSFCQRNAVTWLALFGSALRGEMREDSDIDLLVEFEADAQVSLLDLAGMELELTGLLGRRVDLRTPPELSRHFRDQVLSVAEVLYAA
jgi:hypothetical protein